jgi:predicted AAA+ superfamily ATPase
MFRGKIIIVLGARQTGKTTLIRQLVETSDRPHVWLNADEPDVRNILTDISSTALGRVIGNRKLIVIDEAQRIRNIGLSLKIAVEHFPGHQFLVTGSSALELANAINEPLTGRKIQYQLFPLAYREMSDHHGLLEERRLLENRLIYGSYPEVTTSPGRERELLQELADSYLYKDLFNFQDIKKPALLEKLLQALALQLGNEVSFHELGQLIGADKQTVERYIDLLEKAFVLFRLGALSRNSRNEIKQCRKIYFYDTGIRNAIIKNFNPLALRGDVGALWENYLLTERLKINAWAGRQCNRYFWRTTAQSEVDYIEEYEGLLHAWEFKWNQHKVHRLPRAFQALYPEAAQAVITPANFEDFVLE